MPTRPPDKFTLITSQLFESYLACPTKCYLQATGELAAQNDFAAWRDRRRRFYRLDHIRSLKSEHSRAVDGAGLNPRNWRHASWDFAFNQVARTQHCEAHIHAVQRIEVYNKAHSAELIPLHFVPENKLSRFEKLVAAFDAFVLAKAIAAAVHTAKIIHGENQTTIKLRIDKLLPTIRTTINRITSLLSSASPPDLILNDHCRECDFQVRCKMKAMETNDLSLLANMSETERARLNKKGIFTIDQLSYTFRPRRRSKRYSTKSEKYHHSLKALAIREKKIHVVGDPQLRVDGTPVYFDVESLPDRDNYYLIGIRAEESQGLTRHSLWSDKAADEERMWRTFIDVLSRIDRPVLIHYGSFETTFLKRMCARYGGPPEGSRPANAIMASVNVLSLIFAQIYFPTYSNGLKEIARCLGHEWSDPLSSGLQSIVWRQDWEASGDPAIRAKLTAYNMEDCDALSLVAQAVGHVCRSGPEGSTTSVPPIGRVNPEIIEGLRWRAGF
jgi:predicted RecB family nuclease